MIWTYFNRYFLVPTPHRPCGSTGISTAKPIGLKNILSYALCRPKNCSGLSPWKSTGTTRSFTGAGRFRFAQFRAPSQQELRGITNCYYPAARIPSWVIQRPARLIPGSAGALPALLLVSIWTMISMVGRSTKITCQIFMPSLGSKLPGSSASFLLGIRGTRSTSTSVTNSKIIGQVTRFAVRAQLLDQNIIRKIDPINPSPKIGQLRLPKMVPYHIAATAAKHLIGLRILFARMDPADQF